MSLLLVEAKSSVIKKVYLVLGTNDRQLIRLIVTRCEIDMTEIKAAFQQLFGESLRECIKGDTSGSYKKALYTLIGEKSSS